MHNGRSKEIQELAKQIQGIRFAMLTTTGQTGALHSRPMTTQQIEFDGDVWFFARAGEGATEEIALNPSVNVAYSDNDKGLWVSMAGKAEVLRDQAKINELWNPIVKAYFPDGPEDPELRLIRVDVQSAEYWDAPSSKTVRLFNMLKAAVTGKEDDHGEHGKVNLS